MTTIKKVKNGLLALALVTTVAACHHDDDHDVLLNIGNEPQQLTVDLGTHKLESYVQLNNTEYLVVFESGLGYGAQEWFTTGILEEIGDLSDVLLYDRAGYANSEIGPGPRDIQKLSAELEKVIEPYLNSRKVILVCHSLGGPIARDYTLKNPDKVASILFIDPSHESFNNLNAEKQEFLNQIHIQLYGEDHGATLEAQELSNDWLYVASLADLPNIPVTVLTSMKQDQGNNDSDEINEGTRESWYNAHEELGVGLSDFTHVSTLNSGHGINFEEPALVTEHIKILLSK